MADFSVPILPIGGLDQTIARGPDLSWIANIPNAYWQGQEQAFKQRNQNLFQQSLPRDANGNIDWNKASQMALQAGGTAAIPEAVSVGNLVGAQNIANRPPSFYDPTGGPGNSGYTTPMQSGTGSPSSASAVPSTPTVVGDAEGIRRGLYEAPSAPGARPPVQAEQQAQPASFGQRFAVAQPQAFPPSTAGLGIRSQQPPQQVAQAQAQAQAQAPAPDSQAQQQEMTAARAAMAASVYRQRQEAAAGFGNKAVAEAEGAKAAFYEQQVQDIRKSLLERAMPTGSQKEMRDPAVAAGKARDELVKADVAGYSASSAAAQKAASTAGIGLQRIEDMKALIQSPNYYSGPLAKGVQTFQQYRSIFGRDPNTAQPMEAFNKGVQDLVREQIKALSQAGVGRVMLAEVRNIQKSVASPDNTPAGNRTMLESLRRSYFLQEGLGQVAQQVAKEVSSGQVPLGQYQSRFQELSDAYSQSHPMFTPQEINDPRLIGAVDAPANLTQQPLAQVRAWASQHNVRPGDALRLSDGSYIKAP